jgi:hypothetical protein
MSARSKKPKATESESLTPEQLSARWHGSPSPRTLDGWRRRGVGPKWFHVGGKTSRVLYTMADVEAYEAAQKAKAGR